MSDTNDLHNEGETLPVHAYTEMLAEQFLARSYQSHCAADETTSSASFRPMRRTLNDINRDRLKQHINNKEQLNRKENKNAFKCIHWHTVHIQLIKYSNQPGTPPPNIAEDEQTLSRIARNRLAHLTTGWCSLLSFCLISFCKNVDSRCPKCDVAPLDVNHIFNCSKIATDLKLIELWKRPVEVAKWLDLIPSVLHDRTSQKNPHSLPVLVP